MRTDTMTMHRLKVTIHEEREITDQEADDALIIELGIRIGDKLLEHRFAPGDRVTVLPGRFATPVGCPAVVSAYPDRDGDYEILFLDRYGEIESSYAASDQLSRR